MATHPVPAPWVNHSLSAPSTRLFPQIVACLAMLFGALVLIGWGIGAEPLKRVSPEFVAMNPITAICLIITGTSLILLNNPSASNSRRMTGNTLAIVVLLVGAIKIFGYIFGIPIRLDALLFRLQLEEVQLKIPNQVAPNTALNFVLLGLALLCIDVRRFRFPLSNALALFVATISMAALLGYAYGVTQLSRVSPIFIPMALHTAFAFLLLALGLLFARHDFPLPTMFTPGDASRIIAWRLFPAATLFIFLMGWLRLYGERLGYYPGALGTALFVVVMMVAFTALIWWTANTTGKLAAEKSAANAALMLANEKLEESYRHVRLIMDHATEIICSLDHEHRILTINEACETILSYSANDLRGRSFLEFIEENDHPKVLSHLMAARQDLANISFACKRRDGTSVKIAWSFQWSPHYQNLYGVGRAMVPAESLRA